MAEQITNKLPWSELISCIPATDPQRTRAAQRFFMNRRFANSSNQQRRGVFRRIADTAFDRSLPFIDIAQRIFEEIKQNSDAKALDSCVSKIEKLGIEGWYRAAEKVVSIKFPVMDLEVQLQPDEHLINSDGDHLFLYAYFRQSPPLRPDSVRALLHLLEKIMKGKIYNNARVVILDCYNDTCYEASDFQIGEPWIIKQTDKVLATYNVSYRASLNGSPPPQAGNNFRSKRKPGLIRNQRTTFFSPTKNQMSLQFM